MGEVQVLPETSSVYNLQKFCISSTLLPASSHGKFASIIIQKDAVCLCQIFLSETLHPSFCKIDISVYGHSNSVNDKFYPAKKCVKSISLSDINILTSVNNLKSVTVSVVFTSTSKNKRKCPVNKLSEIVKNILKLFVIKSSSLISLDCLKMLIDIDIHCVLVENTGNVTFGRVVSATKIRINNLMSKITFDQVFRKNEDLPPLGGLETPLKTLTELVKTAGNRSNPYVYKQVLLLGPSGCGKTALVHKVARDCGLVLRTVLGPELSSPLPGEAEEALTAMFDECRQLAQECPGGCILLLDQVDSLCRREDSREGHLVRLSNQLFNLLESVGEIPGLIVVGTSNRPQAMDQAVRRPGRFDVEIHIEVSSESERESIVRSLTRHWGLSDLVSDRVAQWTPGFVGADLALLMANVTRYLQRMGLPLNYDEKEKLLSYWHTCVCQLQPSALRGQLGVVSGDKSSFDDLGGVDEVKRSLLQAVEWPLIHQEAFKRLGLPQPKGVLLFGPPGCAKTSLVRAVAAATNTTFLAVSAAHIYSPYVGDAERTISELFHRARIGAPAILFIDEIDALVGCRGHREKGSQDRILTAFLTEMDGVGVRVDSGTQQIGVVVVAATNRPDVLDPALTRPGRFDRLVYVGPPDTGQRLDILRTVTKRMPLAADVDLAWLADNTTLFSGADLAQLTKEAGLCALTQDGMAVTEVNHKHWVSALMALRPSLSKAQIDHYQRLATMGCFSSPN